MNGLGKLVVIGEVLSYLDRIVVTGGMVSLDHTFEGPHGDPR